MRKKIIGIFVVMLFIIQILPSTTATPTLPFGNEKKVFKNCYIEATGDVEPAGGSFLRFVMFKCFFIRPQGGDSAFVFLWLIEFLEPNAEVTIYNEKDGEILWQDTGLTGVWGFKLFWFKGTYTNEGSTDDQLVVNLEGTAKKVTAYTGE
jgi:hypothetical protein